MGENLLTGDLTRRIKKYDTEKERQEGKKRAYEKYKAKKYYCEICNKTMTLYNYREHIETKLHLKKKIGLPSHSKHVDSTGGCVNLLGVHLQNLNLLTRKFF